MKDNRYYLKTNARYVGGQAEEDMEVFTTVNLDEFIHETIALVDQVVENVSMKDQEKDL